MDFLKGLEIVLSIYFLTNIGYTYTSPVKEVKRLEQRAPDYSSVVVFGASYCDNGHPRSNEYSASLRLYPYYQGRYTNGIIWAEWVAKNLKVPLYDYAYGGATVNNQLSWTKVPDTASQIKFYISDVRSGKINRGSGKVIHMIWVGINDINQIWHSQGGVKRVEDEVASIKQQIYHLLNEPTVNSHVSEVHVLTIPPLQLVPNEIAESYQFYSQPNALRQVQYLVETYNQYLTGAIRDLNSPMVHVHDITGFWYNVHYNPSNYGFSHVSRYCLYGSQICSDPNDFMYFDSLHPSARMHNLIAEFVLKSINRYDNDRNESDLKNKSKKRDKKNDKGDKDNKKRKIHLDKKNKQQPKDK